jgi:AraC-like DNA-binding protein
LIQESRLHKALNTIMQGSMTIAEIAYEVGFNSPTYFTRAFKKRFGITPTEFAKNTLIN